MQDALKEQARSLVDEPIWFGKDFRQDESSRARPGQLWAGFSDERQVAL